ncbi:hypothetical protein MKX01_029176 [Papaver californicum]|nr:hypothetical protein MKX01_029176 [Papaver californicum]
MCRKSAGTVIQVDMSSKYVQPVEPSTCRSSKCAERDDEDSPEMSWFHSYFSSSSQKIIQPKTDARTSNYIA